jgi:hypothetical protein
MLLCHYQKRRSRKKGEVEEGEDRRIKKRKMRTE